MPTGFVCRNMTKRFRRFEPRSLASLAVRTLIQPHSRVGQHRFGAALTYYHEHREEMADLEKERDDLVQNSLAGTGTTPEDLRREHGTN
jgi:hypothetical protein